jgi:N-acetylglutamate synthase
MNLELDGYLVSTDEQLLDIGFISRGLNQTYWAEHRTRSTIEESIKNSICFGIYKMEPFEQIGFARVVTDKVTFSWICDVFIEERSRGKGLGKWLVQCVTDHPIVKRSLSVLGTRDAHGLYERCGFIRSEMMRRGAFKTEPDQGLLPTPMAVMDRTDSRSAATTGAADRYRSAKKVCPTEVKIRTMVLDDYEEVARLWSATEGLSLSDDDSREGIAIYLKRNAGLCFVSVDSEKIVGTVLCGHDGRRGILRHLAVAREFRKNGLARLLIRASLDALAGEGIKKCNIFVMDFNVAGLRFWEHIGAGHLEYDWRTLQLPTDRSLLPQKK